MGISTPAKRVNGRTTLSPRNPLPGIDRSGRPRVVHVKDMRQTDDTTTTPPPATQAARKPVSLVWVGFWLALVLVGAKAFSLGVPHSWNWLLQLTQVSFRDVLFALAFGTVGEGLAWLLLRWPRLSSAVRAAVVAACALCALYGVVAYGVFQALDRPLSFDLLRLMRGSAVKSSITERLTLPITIALIATPLAFLGAALHGSRRRVFSPALLGAMGLWIAVGASSSSDAAVGRRALRLRLSPHVELLRSSWVNLTGRRHTVLPQEFLPGDQDELRVFGNRGAAPRTGFVPMAETARPRNVIVMILESVGTKYLSCYGSPYATTPHLLEESRHALVFDNFYAHAPYTFETFMAANFSIYPGLPWSYAPAGWAPDWRPRLPPTLASVLHQRGWRTAYLHNGDMDWGGEKAVIERAGYDTIEDYHDLKAPELTSWGAEDRFLIDRLIQWIDEKPGQPFLAYCWTDQTHNPYARRPGSQRLDFFAGLQPPAHAEMLARYLNVLHETDEHLGRLFAALRERGLADDTLVVITGDHGEAFGDPHDQQGHGFTVFQEEVHVPLMLWNPRLFPEGRRLADIGGHVDLNPTVADLLGADIPDAWQGHSLFASARPDRTFFVASVDDFLLGIREDRWKYIFEATSGRESLFDLRADPGEQVNLLAAEPERVTRLRQRLAAWIAFEDQFLGAAPAAAAR